MHLQWNIYECTPLCSGAIILDASIDVTTSHLVLPERTLAVGIYQIALTASTTTKPTAMVSASVFVKINPSDIKVNLLQFGTSMVTHSFNQNLTLDPGTYTIDPDTYSFNASVCNMIVNESMIRHSSSRTGIIAITVVSTVYMIFQTMAVRATRLMIPALIQTIHRVCRMWQVNVYTLSILSNG